MCLEGGIGDRHDCVMPRQDDLTAVTVKLGSPSISKEATLSSFYTNTKYGVLEFVRSKNTPAACYT